MALEQIELEVPTTLSDIKLSQYQKYMKIIEQNKMEDAEDKEKLNDFLNMKLIEIFCNVSLRDVIKIPLKEYTQVFKKSLSFSLSSASSILFCSIIFIYF